jgi:phosphatidate cytidylyltransferase
MRDERQTHLTRRFDWLNLRQRAMSAFILAPIAILAVCLGGWLFLLVMAAAIALLAHEWSVMTARARPLGVALAIAVGLLAAEFVAYRGHYHLAWIVLLVAIAGCAIVAKAVRARAADAAFGAFYLGGPCLALTWVRLSPDGLAWTILLLAVTWAADIGAFAVGNIVGGPKLWPRFSPNKTWSGFVGALIVAMGVGASVTVAFGSHMRVSLGAAALMGLIGGLATMAGDLLESILKRRFGVKDSGDLIPGHGGLLDRVDGLMIAILAVAAARLIHLAGWAA